MERLLCYVILSMLVTRSRRCLFYLICKKETYKRIYVLINTQLIICNEIFAGLVTLFYRVLLLFFVLLMLCKILTRGGLVVDRSPRMQKICVRSRVETT